MATAEMVVDGLPGFAGLATLYRIDPPISGADHLIVYHRPKIAGQVGQMTVVLGTSAGVAKGVDIRPQPGTYTTDEPNHALALQLAGGYLITEGGA